ncbi:Arm DNA-binding domain-containing protein, partial [Phocaeicola vulgatus]|nr:Arm DNA-binding domain-containing protein [Phocaeicola vulgatus]
MLEKIRYRLVFNRQKKLNKQGTALVQVEAYLNQRKIYLKTNVYLKPECWSREGAQVINHPQSNELNTMLYEYILYLQGIELGYWKRGIPATL